MKEIIVNGLNENKGMDAVGRLKILSEQMSFEPAEDRSSTGGTYPDNTAPCPDAVFVHPAILPSGQKIKLLKTLLTSACEKDCYYCSFRAGRDFQRATFQPEEFARLFSMLTHKGVTEGIFLSSGIAGGGIRTQDKLIDTANILRHKMGFKGYIHLKIMPGAERSQVERAMQLANRVSINLEAPSTERLARLAPNKQFIQELLQPLKWIDEIRRTQPAYLGWQGRWPSSATQFVAGGSGESDLELMTATQYLYRHLALQRVYYSRFNPVPDTPLENLIPALPIRETRLYQASFLLRDYGFDLEELPFESDGLLPLLVDPKMAWAQQNLGEQPIEINTADRHLLLRIPGIGPKGADTILKARRLGRICDLPTLRNLGILTNKAASFLLINGNRATYQPILL